eukprot:4711758-Prymnesium_polylepis.1
MERLERVDEVDHLGGSESGSQGAIRAQSRCNQGAIQSPTELIVVPVAVLVLAKVEEAHARRAVERRAAAPLAKRIDGFKLSRGHREASAAELALRPGEMAAAALRLLAHAAQPLDVPLLRRVSVLLEDRLVLPLMMKRAVALADADAVAVLTARLAVLWVVVVSIELVTAAVEMRLLQAWEQQGTFPKGSVRMRARSS